MQRDAAFAKELSLASRGPLVIRKGDPHVSTDGGRLGWGPVVINHGPPPPISEAVLERVQELIAAAREKEPEAQA